MQPIASMQSYIIKYTVHFEFKKEVMYPHLLQILGYSVVALAEPHCKTKNKHSVTDVKEKSDVVIE